MVLENSDRNECLGDFSVVKKLLMFPKETQPRFIKPCHRAKRIKYFFLRLQLILKLKYRGKNPTYERSVKFLQEMCKDVVFKYP